MERITPEEIGKSLPSNVIFVFGSNESGIHGAGAARLAYDFYGARLNQGFGIMGQSFGIPTKDWEINELNLHVIKGYVDRFIAFTKRPVSDKWNFYVTRIGCGLAGYTAEDIAPMFLTVRNQKNIWLPKDFIDIVDKLLEAQSKQLIYDRNKEVKL